jgi:hypothetical protein
LFIIQEEKPYALNSEPPPPFTGVAYLLYFVNLFLKRGITEFVETAENNFKLSL